MTHRGAESTFSSPAPLDELVTLLRTLISLAESGQWDAVAAFDQRIQALLKQLRDTDRSLSPDQVREAVSLHRDALKRCEARMTCIEPLIKAFDENLPRVGT